MVQSCVANGLEHGVLLDRRWGCGVSEAMSRHPTCKESHNAASETRHPQVRNVRFSCLPGQRGSLRAGGHISAPGHGVPHETFVDGRSLDVRCDDDRVFS